MGEIRETVTLTNATDEALARRGLLTPDEVRRTTVVAVVSNDAVRCAVPRSLVDRLGVHVEAAGWSAGVAGPILFACQGRATIDEATTGGDAVVIGRTVLAKWDLLADADAGRLVPHPARPDQAVSMVR